MDETQQREVVALVTWIESFPCFGERVVIPRNSPDDSGNTSAHEAAKLLKALDQLPMLRGLRRVAEEILNESLDLETNENDTQEPREEGPPEETWKRLLERTKARIRQQNNNNGGSSGDGYTPMLIQPSISAVVARKIIVLANLLDCVVHHPNMTQRRQYIGRILHLSKSTQKRLMSMIERRGSNAGNTSNSKSSSGRKSSSSGSKSSSSASTPGVNNVSARIQQLNSESTGSAQPILKKGDAKYSKANATPLKRNQSDNKIGSAGVSGSKPSKQQKRAASNPCGTSSSLALALTSPNAPTTPGAAAAKTAKDIIRTTLMLASTPDSCSTGDETPDMDTTVSPTVLIDATRDELHNTIRLLHQQNSDLRAQVSLLEQEHAAAHRNNKNGKDRATNDMRQQMIRLEATYLERQDELESLHKVQITALNRKIDQLEEETRKGREAMEDLARLRDEVELMEHSQAMLAETSEKLRKYREKVSELQDVKDALQREQEAHAKSVEDAVQLENQVQSLMPIKRQVDDYKIRAIEAEVKLVECQDYIRRLEEEKDSATDANNGLYKQSIVQKQQMEELAQRIKRETETLTSSSQNVGEGMSELNPEIKAELMRLRNENLNLRTFAAERQGDAVEGLQQKLEEKTALAERYKQEYLTTKETLMNTQSDLADSKAERTQLSRQLEKCQKQLESSEQESRRLSDELNRTNQDLDETRIRLEEAERRKAELLQQVQQLTDALQKAEARVREADARVEQVKQELFDTKMKLESTEKTAKSFKETAAAWEGSAKAMEQEVIKSQEELSEADEKLERTRRQLHDCQQEMQKLESTLEQAEAETKRIETQLSEEKKASAHALDATREILTTKYQQDLRDQGNRMEQLLRQERDAREQLRDATDHEIDRLRQERSILLDDCSDKVRQAMEENRRKIDSLRESMEDEVTRAKREGEQKLNSIIEKGRGLINEAKAKAKIEMKRMDDENRALDEQLAETRQEKHQLEESMRRTVATLKQRLEFSSKQISELTCDMDEWKDKAQDLEREKSRLQDDNERYRRQMGGRFGAKNDAQSSQLDKLQKEYAAVLEENRNLKRQARSQGQSDVLMGQGGNEGGDSSSSSFGRQGGSFQRGTLSQMRQEYEETISALNDEKRELVMKNTAAMTDIEKAEKRTWERDQEVSRLKAELTSIKLKMQRAELLQSDSGSVSSSGAGVPSTPPRRYSSRNVSSRASRSPTIDRAMRERNQHESILRNTISSLRNIHSSTPTKAGRYSPTRGMMHMSSSNCDNHSDSSIDGASRVLAPTQKHEQAANLSTSGLFRPILRPEDKPSQSLSVSLSSHHTRFDDMSDI